jgi:L-arabinose isomerase
MSGMEYLLIDADSKLANFKNELRWNDAYYHLANGF